MTVSSQLKRFFSVGVLNTSLDIGIYSLLHSAGMAIVVANFISTSCGLACSFYLNGRFTFRASVSWRHAIPFLIVNFLGLWALQPAIIHVVQPMTVGLSDSSIIQTVLPKFISVAILLVWNYVLYTRWVFATKTPNNLAKVSK
jgi:putative flippase GtrA